MEVYLVGGAVRDELLGRPVSERDWVVVGAAPADLERLGYRRVGADFPVFLHPQTNEEYALARRERKTAPGYHGFITEFSPDVSLEDDLKRRDLTINAMARRGDGSLVDPHGGRKDLESRQLRHVSAAFVEDPVRILRVARFAARYEALGFTIAPETRSLMQSMVASGEVQALVAERVWQEMARALMEPTPEVFFQVLRDCGALRVILPEVDRLFGVPQPEQWHPEIDTGLHVMMALRLAADAGASLTVRFAVLMHDLGKGLTPPHRLPQHPGHEDAGVPSIDAVCNRLRVPNDCRELARLASRFHTHVHRAAELRTATVLQTLELCDAFRRPARFAELLDVCTFDARGRRGLERRDYPQAAQFASALAAAQQAALSPLEMSGLDGALIGERLRRRRLDAIEALGLRRREPLSPEGK
jgi:tRNA nucleotidyltransferase (CCA-adding enzyme)